MWISNKRQVHPCWHSASLQSCGWGVLLCLCTLVISWREGEFEIAVCTEHMCWYFLWFRIQGFFTFLVCFVFGVIHSKFCFARSKWEVFGINSLLVWLMCMNPFSVVMKRYFMKWHIENVCRGQNPYGVCRGSLSMWGILGVRCLCGWAQFCDVSKGSHENGVILTCFRVGLCCNSLKHSLPFPHFTCQLELINYEQMTGLLIMSKTMCCG